MTAQHWISGRQKAGLTQVQAARRLGLSQPYLSQLEKGSRSAGPALTRKAVALYRLPPSVLPLPKGEESAAAAPARLQEELAALGYPGFAHVRSSRKHNPAVVVLTALLQQDLDARLVEALPWVIGTYTDLNWQWLRDHARLRNAQNRLGYVVYLAKAVIGSRDENAREILSAWERDLEESRLAREDTLGRDSMATAERLWLKTHRPAAAAHWNLLTSLSPEQLPYAGR